MGPGIVILSLAEKSWDGQIYQVHDDTPENSEQY